MDQKKGHIHRAKFKHGDDWWGSNSFFKKSLIMGRGVFVTYVFLLISHIRAVVSKNTYTVHLKFSLHYLKTHTLQFANN